MKFLSSVIVNIFVNVIALLAAAYFISGFVFQGTFLDFLTAAVILTIINLLIKPILKLLLGPFIVLSFGLLIIVVNAITLYLLDFFIDQLTIQGLIPLFLATLLVSAINFIFQGAAKIIYRS